MAHHLPPHEAGTSRPPRYRPKARWFVVGGVLLLLSPVIFLASLFTVLGPLAKQDAVIPADGATHSVSVAPRSERALFTRGGTPVSCTSTDGTGADVPLRPVGGSFTVNDWQAVARFDTGDGRLTLRCDPGSAAEVRVGQIPSWGTFAGGLAVGIIGPLLLGGIGFVVLVVTGVLWATRPPRPRTT